jgi:hypothetical protein
VVLALATGIESEKLLLNDRAGAAFWMVTVVLRAGRVVGGAHRAIAALTTVPHRGHGWCMVVYVLCGEAESTIGR